MLSFDKSDRAIAVIKGGPYNQKIVYLHADIDLREKARIHEQGLDEMQLNLGNFLVIPQNIECQREEILVSGCSGSGKSYWTGNYIKAYHVTFPKNRIFVISKKTEDPSYDKYPFIQRIDVDESFLEDGKLEPYHFKDSLVVFDDIENIPNKAVKEAVYELKDNLSMTGRSENVYLVICNHMTQNYKVTRNDLNEADSYVIFKNNSPHHTKSLLEKYVGLDKQQIKKIMDLPSRWVFIKKNFPKYVVSETDTYIL